MEDRKIPIVAAMAVAYGMNCEESLPDGFGLCPGVHGFPQREEMPRIPCCEIVGPGLQSSLIHDFKSFKNAFRPVNGTCRPSCYQAAIRNRSRIFEVCSPLVRRREHIKKTYPVAGMPPGIQQAGFRKSDGGAADCCDASSCLQKLTSLGDNRSMLRFRPCIRTGKQ